MKQNRFGVAGDVVHLLLPSTDGAERVALIDPSDLPAVLGYGNWRAQFQKRRSSMRGGYWLAYASQSGKSISLHRFVTSAPPRTDVDHINRDTLDNRRCNLRLATKSENQQNITGHRDSKSGYRNVYWNEHSGTWHVQVCLNYKRYFGGIFKDLEEANRAAIDLRRRLHPCCPENAPLAAREEVRKAFALLGLLPASQPAPTRWEVWEYDPQLGEISSGHTFDSPEAAQAWCDEEEAWARAGGERIPCLRVRPVGRVVWGREVAS